MEVIGKVEQVGNAENVISVLSPARKPGARITFLQAHKALKLGLRTQPTGKQSYVVVRRPAGSTKLCIITLCNAASGEKHAVKLAIKVNEQLDRGENPNEKKRAARDAERAEKSKAKHSFLSVGEAYIARCKRHGRREATLREYRRILHGDDLQPLHARPVSTVTSEDVEHVVAKVRERAPMMANAIYKFTRGMFSYALANRVYSLTVDPLQHFDRLEHLQKERARKRTLVHPYTGDMTELRAVWQGVEDIQPANHPARALVRLLILTGLRVGTLAKVHHENALLWRHVKDLDKPTARLEVPWNLRKTGEEGDDVQTVPLVPAAVAILQGLAKVGEDAPVFTTDGRNSLRVDSRLRRLYRELADKAAGRALEPWTIHDLRRSVATGLGFIGCPHVVIDEILDHAGEAKAGIRGTYDLSSRVELRREWLQKWADRLTGKEG